ncbi:PREDICTED: signal recognition particle receptor subunit beta-like [Priapulus caudatus]|uniref:Signal recognition particle receptor subunit beta n=1 Tax=Priapulus caudatus TaxID=37621 RepID=A0ABM1ET58_PRICU|nr:PREDICTED: signal recognition particle receptor subunit beta-like [Priapulus caudatus]
MNGEPLSVGIVVALVVILLTLVIFRLFKQKTDRKGVLLLGLCEAGKTLLYARLVHGKYIKSYTSQKENKGLFHVKDKKKPGILQIVDLPGYERVRSAFFEKSKNTARGIIFVVDSVTAQKDMRDVAELLYNVLSDKFVSSNGIPVLIACNKQDVTMAKSAKALKPLLEKEMNMLRITRAAALESIDSSGSGSVHLGKRGKDFEFSHLGGGVKVEFCDCSAHGSESGDDGPAQLAPVIEWLAKLV